MREREPLLRQGVHKLFRIWTVESSFKTARTSSTNAGIVLTTYSILLRYSGFRLFSLIARHEYCATRMGYTYIIYLVVLGSK